MSWIKNLLAGGLYYSGINSLFSRWKGHAVVLAYHRVLEHYREPLDLAQDFVPLLDFRRQIEFLLKTHKPISLLDLITQNKWNEPVFAITFDDGYRDNYTYAFPALQDMGVTATLFIATDVVSGRDWLWWDKLLLVLHKAIGSTIENAGRSYSIKDEGKLFYIQKKMSEMLAANPNRNEFINKIMEKYAGNKLDAQMPYMSWDEVKQLQAAGWTIGAHTVSHPLLTALSPDKARHEIVNCAQEIAEHIGEYPRLFAYPNGKLSDTSAAITAILQENNFAGAVILDEHQPLRFTDPYLINRIAPLGGESHALFKLRLSNLYYRFN
jgi:peptidoglycan/xylan/chitin deacetylase (PgdA/CDA1 family)